MTEVACTDCGKRVLAATVRATGGFCMPCAKKRKRQLAPPNPIPEDEPDPLSPDTAHPAAKALMVEDWFWSIADDDAPLGNDTGADTLSFLREWRADRPSADPMMFLGQLLRQWEVPDKDWSLLEPELVGEALRTNHYAVLTRDDTVIAVAFGLLVIEGKVPRPVCERAIDALRRQALPEVMAFRSWTDPTERRARLARMRAVLDRLRGPA